MRGQGHIQRRGRWWRICWSHNGHKHWESVHSTQRKDAIALLTQRLAEADQGLLPTRHGTVKMAELFDALEAYLEDERQAKSFRTIRYHLRPVRQFFGAYHASQVTERLVQQYIARRKAAGKANATINWETGLLGQAFRLAMRRRQVLRLPHIARLRNAAPRTGFFARHEVEAIAAHLPPYLVDVVWFAYYTGWRKGEILGLEWREIDFAERVIRLDGARVKNRASRLLGVQGPLWEILERRYGERATDGVICPWVFHHHGRRIKDTRTAWQTACRKAGLPYKLFHDFRRTAARNMIRAGVPQRIAQEVTGHKTASMFDRYNIVDEQDTREAMAKVAAYTEAAPRGRRDIR